MNVVSYCNQCKYWPLNPMLIRFLGSNDLFKGSLKRRSTRTLTLMHTAQHHKNGPWNVTLLIPLIFQFVLAAASETLQTEKKRPRNQAAIIGETAATTATNGSREERAGIHGTRGFRFTSIQWTDACQGTCQAVPILCCGKFMTKIFKHFSFKVFSIVVSSARQIDSIWSDVFSLNSILQTWLNLFSSMKCAMCLTLF